MEIILDKADKGGPILIYPPKLAEEKIKEMVMERKLYEKMDISNLLKHFKSIKSAFSTKSHQMKILKNPFISRVLPFYLFFRKNKKHFRLQPMEGEKSAFYFNLFLI